MIPRTTLIVDRPVASLDAILGRMPRDRRFRVVFEWPGVATTPPLGCIRAARAAGFRRIRLAAGVEGIGDAALLDAVEAGTDEVSVPVEGPAPWQRLAELRAEGRLAFVALVVTRTLPDAPDRNPCNADECFIDLRADSGKPGQGPPAWLREATEDSRFRKVAVRGLPLCEVPGLDPDRIVSNTWEVRLSLGAAVVPFEAPGREYRQACACCRLSAACDGFPPSPGTTGLRVRPPTGLSGRAPVLAVLAGARNCGRFVVSRPQVGRQVAMLRRLGLHVTSLDPDSTPRDGDSGSGSAGLGAIHVFYSRDRDGAEAAAALESRFAAHGTSADWTGFTSGLGRLFGYPDCCIEAFLAAGPSASLSELVRLASRRTIRFDARLNVLDALSPFSLVPHVPCRFDCEPSLRMAARVLAALPSLFPCLDGTAALALGRPALFVDARRIASFEGEPYPGGIRYATVDSPAFRPGSGRDETFVREWLPALAAGDRLEVSNRQVRILAGRGTVAVLDADTEPVILPFRAWE